MNKIIFEKCILCGSQLDKNIPPEHIIPEYLGGRLKLLFLCKSCNHGIGARLYSKLKFDVLIRKASYLLRNELPKIHKSIENQQVYKTTSPVGTPLKAFRRKTKIEVVAQKRDNWIVLPTQSAAEYIEKELIKTRGKTLQEAKQIAEKIEQTPNNKLEKITEGFSIIRWDAEKFQLDLASNNTVKETVVLLMAYEYLSILLGKVIYQPIFNHVRENILHDVKSKYIKVNFRISKKPQPFHSIFPEFEDKLTRINIHFFEYCIYQVEFIKLHVNKCIDLCYLEDLKNRKSLGALSVSEGKSNQWHEFTF